MFVLLVLTALFLLLLLLSDGIVRSAAGTRAHDVPDHLPHTRTALVLGTSRYLPGGRTNRYFTYRLQAAQELLDREIVEYLIVSGDNERYSYNEPVEMKKALQEMGVPEERIILDYAGFRTLDSVIRCREVFGQEQYIIVSQRFHNERALFIAGRYGIDAYAYNARDVGGAPGTKVRIREYFARVKAILDLYLLGTGPRFLGESVEVPPPAGGADGDAEAAEDTEEPLKDQPEGQEAEGQEAGGPEEGQEQKGSNSPQ